MLIYTKKRKVSLSKENLELLENDRFHDKNEDYNIEEKENLFILRRYDNKFEYTFRIIRSKNKKKIHHKCIDSIKLNDIEILKEKNLDIEDNKYSEYLLKMTEILPLFRTRNQHFLNQKYLSNWGEYGTKEKIPYYHLNNQSNKKAEEIFTSRFLYRYIQNNKIWYIEDGIIIHHEDQFSKLVNELRELKYKENSFIENDFWIPILFTIIRSPYLFNSHYKLLTTYLIENTENDEIDDDNFELDYLNYFIEHTYSELLMKNTEYVVDDPRVKYYYFNVDMQNSIDFIPLKSLCVAFHIQKYDWHKNLKADFCFLPLSKSEAVFICHESFSDEINKIIKSENNEMYNVIEFYLSTEDNKNDYGVILNDKDYAINLNNIYKKESQ